MAAICSASWLLSLNCVSLARQDAILQMRRLLWTRAAHEGWQYRCVFTSMPRREVRLLIECQTMTAKCWQDRALQLSQADLWPRFTPLLIARNYGEILCTDDTATMAVCSLTRLMYDSWVAYFFEESLGPRLSRSIEVLVDHSSTT